MEATVYAYTSETWKREVFSVGESIFTLDYFDLLKVNTHFKKTLHFTRETPKIRLDKLFREKRTHTLND